MNHVDRRSQAIRVMPLARNAFRTAYSVILLSCGCAGLVGCISSKNASVPNADLCNLPEIASKASPKSVCSVSLVPFRESGREPVNATLVSVGAGMRQSYDVIQSWNLYFLETPSEGVISLGEFPAWRGVGYLIMYRQIGYDGARGGGIAQREDSFSSRLIEKRGDRYCSVIAMKPPFRGELVDCGEEGKGYDSATGEVGYMPGVLSQQEVARQMCERFAAERGLRCEHNVVYFQSSIFERDATGVGRYRVTVERSTSLPYERTGRPKKDYRERREYVVSVDGKSVHEVSREWRLCTPNVGCPQIPGPPEGEE